MRRKVERRGHVADAAGGEVEIVGERVGDDLRLLEDLLLHEVAVVALVDDIGRVGRLPLLATDGVALGIEDREAVAANHRPVAVFQIGDGIGEGRQRDGIGAEEHLALAMADRQRRAIARADDQIGIVGEHDGEREGAFQPLDRGVGGLDRARAVLHRVGDEVGDDFGVGLRGEGIAVALQFLAQFGEILDDAVVDDRDAARKMRMGVGLVRNAVRGPARVADADRAVERAVVQPPLQIDELALRAPAIEPGIRQRRDAGGIIAAIFEALERVHDQGGDRARAHDSNDTAHIRTSSGERRPA